MSRAAALLLAALLASCGEEMSEQPRADAYEPSRLFADGKVLQAPPEGTVAQDDPAWAAPYVERPPLTLALLDRGRERFGIYCTPCHGAAGYGRGTVPARGFPQPPSFHSARLREATSQHVFNLITHGWGVMYSYADRVPPSDRWAIAAYVRALQLSQAVPLAGLPAGEQADIERAIAARASEARDGS